MLESKLIKKKNPRQNSPESRTQYVFDDLTPSAKIIKTKISK